MIVIIIWNIVITNILKLLDFGIILGTTWIIILITIYPHDNDIIYGKYLGFGQETSQKIYTAKEPQWISSYWCLVGNGWE